MFIIFFIFFFFSSRRRHTRYIGDWSSDVCSSDLDEGVRVSANGGELAEASLAAHLSRSSERIWKTRKSELAKTNCFAGSSFMRNSSKFGSSMAGALIR